LKFEIALKPAFQKRSNASPFLIKPIDQERQQWLDVLPLNE